MANALVIAGLVLTVVGAVVLLLPVRAATNADRGIVGDLGELMKQINALLDKFDKRYRPGIVLMIVGLTLVGVGAYLQSSDSEDSDEDSSAGASTQLLVPDRIDVLSR